MRLDPHTGEHLSFDGDGGTESTVMSYDSTPFTFRLFAFDYVPRSKYVPYMIRHHELADKFSTHPYIEVLEQEYVLHEPVIHVALADALARGREGIMLRDPKGFYKFGRSTLNEQLLIKVKPWHDAEARVIGFVEKKTNNNIQTRDELGYAKRSKHKANLQGCKTLGALKAYSKEFGDFEIGSGFTEEVASWIWQNRFTYHGKVFTFQYRGITTHGKPKHASFKRFRPYPV